MKDMLKMNLQLFAEEVEDVEVDEQEHHKTVSVEEMLRRLERAEEGWKSKYKELEESVAVQVENAKKEAQMDGKELQAHREQLLEKRKAETLRRD